MSHTPGPWKAYDNYVEIPGKPLTGSGSFSLSAAGAYQVMKDDKDLDGAALLLADQSAAVKTETLPNREK